MKKKIISMLLCLTMVLQGSLPAFAEELIVWDEGTETADEIVLEEAVDLSGEDFGEDLIIDEGLFEDVSPELSNGDGALAGELAGGAQDESETEEVLTLESETETEAESEVSTEAAVGETEVPEDEETEQPEENQKIQESELASEEFVENGAMEEAESDGLIEEESEEEGLLEDDGDGDVEVLFTTETFTLSDPTVAHGMMSMSTYSRLRNVVQYDGCYGNQLSGAAREFYNARVDYFVRQRRTDKLLLEYDVRTSPITFKADVYWDSNENKLKIDSSTDEYEEFKMQVAYAVQASLDAVGYDHPELFWARGRKGESYKYGIGASGNERDGYIGYISYIPIEYHIAFEGAETLISAYDNAVPKVAEQIQALADLNNDGQITDAELALEIHDYLCERFEYADEEYKNYQTTGDYRIFCSAGAFLDEVGTRVVCEGYAKAFKVLCDQFGIPCVLIGGIAVNNEMGHMWNGVKIDGKWYFADATWDDPTGASMTHNNFLIGTVTDRISSGNFSASDNTTIFVYPALETEAYADLDGVVHNPVVKSVVQPTCVSGGYTEYICSDRGCKYYRTDDYTEADTTKHNIKEQVIPGTCTEQAYTQYTCTNGCGYCARDNYAEKDPDNHDYAVKSVTEPTCTANGYTTYICSRCSDCYDGNFTAKDADNHDYCVTQVVSATCTTSGYTTYTCSRCSRSYRGDETKPLGHSYKSVVKPPTCKKGYTTYTCTRSGCSHSFVGNETAALGYHPYKNGICPGCGQGDTLTKATISKISSQGYDPKGVEPAITVKFGTNVLKKGIDYKVTCKNNKKLGTAKMTITGIGKYRGTVSKMFEVVKRKADKLTYSAVEDKTYTGKAWKPSVTVRNNGTKLKKNTDYTITYSNNKNIGQAVITIKMKGNYRGTKKLYFTILPKTVSVKTVTSTSRRKMKVTWKKVSGDASYQIQYSLNSNFKSAKTVTVKAKYTTKTIEKLTSKKTYYVRIRGYKKVSGKKYYSTWSKAKKVMIK